MFSFICWFVNWRKTFFTKKRKKLYPSNWFLANFSSIYLSLFHKASGISNLPTYERRTANGSIIQSGDPKFVTSHNSQFCQNQKMFRKMFLIYSAKGSPKLIFRFGLEICWSPTWQNKKKEMWQLFLPSSCIKLTEVMFCFMGLYCLKTSVGSSSTRSDVKI